MSASLSKLPAIDSSSGLLNVVVDTPRHSRCKYKYEPASGEFHLRKLLPAGAVFPYPFGFIPSTRGEDGDPLDVLVIVDEPLFVGCVLPIRLIGVLEAEQRETSGDVVRNDRLIGVIETEFNPPEVRSLEELGEQICQEIKHFFAAYNQFEGRKLSWRGQADAAAAIRIVEDSARHSGRRDGKPSPQTMHEKSDAHKNTPKGKRPAARTKH